MDWRLRLRLFFEWRDIWVGVFVKGPYTCHVEKGEGLYPLEYRIQFYVCVLPCLPLLITLWRPNE